MPPPCHPNKHLRDAVAYALARGWTLTKGGKSSHAWGVLRCGHGARGGCQKSVWSTPRNPEAEARRIRRAVDDCPHSAREAADPPSR